MKNYSGISYTSKLQKLNAARAALLANPELWTFGVQLKPYFSAATRYVRPDGLSTGAGGGLANTVADAWNLAEFLTHQGSLVAYTRVVFTGTFENAVATVTASNLLIDARNATVVSAARVTSWVDTGINGEWKISGATVSSQVYLCLTEDGIILEGLSGSQGGDGVARLSLTAVDTVNDRITLSVGWEIRNGDKIGLVTGALTEIAIGTTYYVVDAQPFAASSQEIGLSLTPGGAKIDLTAAGAGNRYFFTDYSGRNFVPVQGALQPGQFAYCPWEDAIYMRPTTGTPAQHTYYLSQTPSRAAAFSLWGSNTYVLGGFIHTNSRGLAVVEGGAVKSGFLGSTIYSAEDPLVFDTATHPVAILCEVGYGSNHLIGSTNVGTAEPGQIVVGCYAHHTGLFATMYGDTQGIVTNSASNGCYWVDNLITHIARPVTNAQIPTTSSINTGALVIDSSSDCVVHSNYTYMCYGEQIEFGPNDVQDILRTKVKYNIFDLRDLLFSEGTPPRGVNCFVSGPFGMDATNFVINNLFLLGNTFGQSRTGSQDAGVFVARVTTAAGPARSLTIKNNIVVGQAEGQAPAIYALRITNAAYPHFTFVGENNRYIDTGVVAVRSDGVGGTYAWDSTTGIVAYNLASWQAYSSTDTTTEHLDEDELNLDGSPVADSALIEGGSFYQYGVDYNGLNTWNPPSIGAIEYERPRTPRT